MLEEMRIQGLGVIDHALLEFHPGLTVLTGETGAGKTMLVQGLSLLFGGRADPGWVGPGTSRAVVEGRLRMPVGGSAADRAWEAGGEPDDDGSWQISRMLGSARSRAFVGGRGVPAGVLAELGGELMALHGQSDQRRLLRPAAQRDALDRLGGETLLRPLEAYRAAYRRWQTVSSDLTDVTERSRERAREADLLRFGLAEIDEAGPTVGEDDALAAQVARLAHADALGGAAATAHQWLRGDADVAAAGHSDAVGALARARAATEAQRGHDAQLDAITDRLAEVGYLLDDVAADLASYAGSVDTDPAQLAAAQQRQATLAALTRKYGPSVQDVLVWAERSRGRLVVLDGDDDQRTRLVEEERALRAELASCAERVSQAREEAARRFCSGVSAELRDLAMPDALVSAEVSQRTASRDASGLAVADRLLAFGAHGVDEVELLLTPHQGAEPRPLQRGASGGELSRVMLAVEVVLADAAPAPTMIFDEVDAGVGGRAAGEVGRRLARLARTTQVIVVTHLPQVAAFADRHCKVAKDVAGSVTSSGVEALDEAGRRTELSRMLAGVEDSDLARGHAGELRQAAVAFMAGKESDSLAG